MIRKIYLNRKLRVNFLKGKDIEFKDLGISSKNLKLIKNYSSNLKNFFYDKNVIIPSSLIGHRIFYHNGKGIASIKITSFMVGYKLGEFVNLKIRNKLIKIVKK